MIRLQGNLSLHLGPPRLVPSLSDAEPRDELRLTCPPALKETIVRFLETQAARDPAALPPFQLSPHKGQGPTPAGPAHKVQHKAHRKQQQRPQHPYSDLAVGDATGDGASVSTSDCCADMPSGTEDSCLDRPTQSGLGPQGTLLGGLAAAGTAAWDEDTDACDSGAAVAYAVSAGVGGSGVGSSLAAASAAGAGACAVPPVAAVLGLLGAPQASSQGEGPANSSAMARASSSVGGLKAALAAAPVPIKGAEAATDSSLHHHTPYTHANHTSPAAWGSPASTSSALSARPPARPPAASSASSSLRNGGLLASMGPVGDDGPVLDHEDYRSLLALAATYKPNCAAATAVPLSGARAEEKAGAEAPGGSFPAAGSAAAPGHLGVVLGAGTAASAVTKALGLGSRAQPPSPSAAPYGRPLPSSPAGKMVTATAGFAKPANAKAAAAKPGHLTSPESILGLKGMGLEGWAMRADAWEHDHTEA